MISSKKTICMLIYNYFPNVAGGAERQCRLQAHELVRTGYRCYIFTALSNNSNARIENDKGCEIIRIWTVQPTVDRLVAFKNNVFKSDKDSKEKSVTKNDGKGKEGTQRGFLAMSVQWLNTLVFMLGSTWLLYKKRKDIDIIHTHVASWNAGFAGWVGNILDIPVVCKAAYLPPFQDFGNSIPFAGKWRSWRKKIPYIALLPDMAHNLCEQGVLEKNIYIIPNGVIIPDDTAPVAENTSALYVGNFSQGSDHKGFDILLKAWSILSRDVANAHLLIAGGGEQSRWEELAKDLGCYESIEFLGHVQDIGALYKKAGLFVLPSRGEGMSNALLEAQSYGLPSVVSDIPGNREIVVDRKTGIVVPVDDPVQFADAIVELITKKTVRISMGRAARENICKKYSIEKIVEQVKEIYAHI